MSALAIEAWSAWAPGLESADSWRAWARAPQPCERGGAPNALALPPLLRRRCDELSRMFLHVAAGACGAAQRGAVATVFATRVGAYATQVELLETLAAKGPLSPTRFSHSVHNTALGLFSIWSQNHEAGSSLAAAEETFAHGFLEAALLAAREPERRVLLVCGDARYPAPLDAGADSVRGSHALALLLRSTGEGERVHFALESARGGSASPLPQALGFLRWWLSHESAPLRLSAAGRCWVWQRLAASDAAPLASRQ